MAKDLSFLSDQEILRLKISHLRLSLRGSKYENAILEVKEELFSKGIRFNPHIWISEEWFCPDGVSGVAIPFYLLDSRLMKLEKTQIGEVEGQRISEFKKLLRHEIGHAIENAYQTRRLRKRQQIFGNSSCQYPRYYKPNTESKKYVQHLDGWYAQAHPDEDFAETFAVWLTGKWKKTYRGWEACKKLEYMDELMTSLKGIRPKKIDYSRPYEYRDINKTLKSYYSQKIKRLELKSHLDLDREFTSQTSGIVNQLMKLGIVSRYEAKQIQIRLKLPKVTDQQIPPELILKKNPQRVLRSLFQKIAM